MQITAKHSLLSSSATVPPAIPLSTMMDEVEDSGLVGTTSRATAEQRLDRWQDDIGNTDDETAERRQFAWFAWYHQRQHGVVPVSQDEEHRPSSPVVFSGQSETPAGRLFPDDNSFMAMLSAESDRLGIADVYNRVGAHDSHTTGLPAEPERSLKDQIVQDGARTFLLKNLSLTNTTTEGIIAELTTLGCGDFDFIRLPVSMSDLSFRGFAVLHYSDADKATRFVTAVDGRERAVIEVAGKQGVMTNLDTIKWNRRRRRANASVVYDTTGIGTGAPLVRLGGELRPILQQEDVEDARKVYG